MTKKSTGHKADRSSISMNGRRTRKSRRHEGSANDGGQWKKTQRKWKGGGNLTKGGCLPKLFMLLLPLIAAGAILFLGL
jgi:hypothetical protein